MDSGLVEQGGNGKVWERVSAGLFVSGHVHELSGLLLFLAACLALDPVPPPGCPLVVYAGGQVKEGGESGCQDGGTGYWSSCETG